MFRKLYFCINLLRGLPAFWLLSLSGAKDLVLEETKCYTWYLENDKETGFFSQFLQLLCRYPCYRNLVFFRCSEKHQLCARLLRLLFPTKPDLEICGGEIEAGLVIYHGHGSIIAPYRAGKNLSVYQGVTIGRNAPKNGRDFSNPILGDNVSIYANAVVAGGIYIGSNVEIGAGAVVMKDVPDNCVVLGNPCVIREKVQK